LELTSRHPPLPPDELRRLSHLALIDLHRDGGNKDDTNRLNQDLADMLHMVRQVTTFAVESDDDRNGDDPSCSAHIYDTVRGVRATPLRPSPNREQEDAFQQQDEEQAREVWKNLLRPKTIRKGGGHVYFCHRHSG
jgi:hypothetical protein